MTVRIACDMVWIRTGGAQTGCMAVRPNHEWLPMDLVSSAGVFAAAGVSILTLFGLLWRWFISPLRTWLQDVHRVVMYELRPNGGSSIRDVVHDTQATLNAHIADASVHHREQHRDVTEQTEEPS